MIKVVYRIYDKEGTEGCRYLYSSDGQRGTDRWFAMTNSKRKNQFWVLYFGISMGSKFLRGNGSWGKQFSGVSSLV